MTTKEVIICIGLNIRKLREEKGLSIQELSDKLNIEYNNLIRIEKGRTNPTIGTLFKIAENLEVDLSELIKTEE